MFPIGDENQPGHGLPFVTLTLIGINVAVFVLLQGLGADSPFTLGWSAIPFEVVNGVDLVRPSLIEIGGQELLLDQAPGPSPIQFTLLSSMFMHAGLLHIAGNMLFLWIFGDNVEHRAGPVVFLVVYLVTGVIGSLAQIFSNVDSVIPTLGASGAISGVLGAYLVLFPRNRVTVLLFRFPAQVPAIVAIGIWIVFQLISGFGATVEDSGGGGVAYLAHIGGFAAGLVAGFLLRALPEFSARR
ncbi:MAG TPA: rhomboid family intramembrane serine protease [Candidatus Limnocylindria bacterium]|nr:rhomboid family intramembrane serine protease [Candidatus Limnocylindria bacterium]